MFKASLDNFGNDFGHFWICGIFRRLDLPWNTGKNFFRKKMPQNTFEHLRTILDNFRTLKIFCFFSWVFSKYLPQILSPENWIQFFQVRKTEFIFLSSGIWTNNFRSRKSEMGLRILTVAWMQWECLLTIVSENWTHVYKSGKLNSCFLISRIGTHIFKSRESEMPRRDPWAKKKFENIAPNMFKTNLDNFGNDFGLFCNFEFFLIFSQTFDGSMEHWAKKLFQKNRPKTRFDTWERFWTFLELWSFLIFFLNFF